MADTGGADFHNFGSCADFERHIYGQVATGDENISCFLDGLELVLIAGDGVVDRQEDFQRRSNPCHWPLTVCGRFASRLIGDSDFRLGHDAAGLIGDGAVDRAEDVLWMRLPNSNGEKYKPEHDCQHPAWN